MERNSKTIKETIKLWAEFLPTVLFRIRCSPYQNKLIPFEMFGQPPPLIPVKARPQIIELSNRSFLKSLQAPEQTTRNIQSHLSCPPPVSPLTEPAPRFQPEDFVWVLHLPSKTPEPTWKEPAISCDSDNTRGHQDSGDCSLDPPFPSEGGHSQPGER